MPCSRGPHGFVIPGRWNSDRDRLSRCEDAEGKESPIRAGAMKRREDAPTWRGRERFELPRDGRPQHPRAILAREWRFAHPAPCGENPRRRGSRPNESAPEAVRRSSRGVRGGGNRPQSTSNPRNGASRVSNRAFPSRKNAILFPKAKQELSMSPNSIQPKAASEIRPFRCRKAGNRPLRRRTAGIRRFRP